jgi:hypothetical protein
VMSPYTPSSSSARSTAMERRGTQNTENSCGAACLLGRGAWRGAGGGGGGGT